MIRNKTQLVLLFYTMLQTLDTVREGFICPQCHQDMSNMETLQIHFENVHLKQSSTVAKSMLYSLNLRM